MLGNRVVCRWDRAWAVVPLLLWAAPCPAQLPASVADRAAFVDAARLYADACSACHGELGDGEGPGARVLPAPRPRDFTRGVFKFRTTPTGSLPTDEDLYRTISRGVPGTWMPAWEELLTEAQRRALVRYIKGFSDIFAEEEPDPPMEVPTELAATPELVREGRFVYAMLKCWECHGHRGRGDGPAADELLDDWDQRIKAYDFTRGGYKNGSSPRDLYRTLVTGLSGTPMPALERNNVAFPGGRDVDIAPMREALDPEGLRGLEAYLATQPTAADIRTMTEGELAGLVQRRLWALVHYVRSLDRPKGVFYWLFGETPELRGKRDGR